MERLSFLRECISFVHLDPDGHFLGKLMTWMGGIKNSDLQTIRWELLLLRRAPHRRRHRP